MRKKARKERTGFNFWQTLFWTIIVATVLIVITPSAEQDKGISSRGRTPLTLEQKGAAKSTEFIEYLQKNGYSIVQDNFPIFIEVEKKQVDGAPEIVVRQLAEQCYRMTGTPSKIILRTLGRRDIGQYSPP